MSARLGRPDSTGRSSGKIAGRRGKLMKPPEGEPFIWLTRELLTSDAWRSLSINARRFVDFLLIEHMNHAGTENGNLRATYGQLEAFGLTPRCIAAAITEAEAAGLVDCHKGGMRVASTYTLTFYPLSDGTPASNRWKHYGKQKSAPTCVGSKPPQGKADGADLPPQMQVDLTPTKEGPSISCPGRANGHASSTAAQQGGGSGAEQIDIEEAIAAARHRDIAKQPSKIGDLPSWMRGERARRGWPPSLLGEITGLGESGILNIEEGRATVTKTMRNRIVAALTSEARP